MLMARPLRIEFAGALYHVTSRGNERRQIFFCDDDRLAFLDVLEHAVARFGWLCHAYCLMGNHYHLLIETPHANLSQGMRQLNGVYTQYVNRTHRRVGHLFQGRFKGILVEREYYLLALARYVVLNPVRAGMVRDAGDWPWSSYRGTVGMERAPPFLTTDWLLSAFGSERAIATREYARFVGEGKGKEDPWKDLRGQIYLGSDGFVDEMQRLIRDDQPLLEIPVRQRRRPPRSLAYYGERYADRDRALAEAYRTGAYSMQAIADHFGVGRMTVSRAVNKHSPARG
jgi:REP element-mobilizing transposase RayT